MRGAAPRLLRLPVAIVEAVDGALLRYNDVIATGSAKQPSNQPAKI